MLRQIQWLMAGALACSLAGCQEQGDAMPMVVSLAQDGSWLVSAPVCKGDVVASIGVYAIVDGKLRGTLFPDTEQVVGADTVVRLNLGPGATGPGALTPEWPRFALPGLDASGTLPDGAEIGIETRDYYATVTAADAIPLPGQPILVTGTATRRGDGDHRVRVDPTTADNALATWCSSQRK